jgi:hypothetical protein
LESYFKNLDTNCICIREISLKFIVVLFSIVVLAQMEMESPEQKKYVFLVLKKRPTEALFKTIEILLFL